MGSTSSIHHNVVPALDGFPLAVRIQPPQGTARATVLVHSATAARQAYYGRFAELLAHHGVRVVTYDYRGIGGSRPASLRGFEASMRAWGELDAPAMHRYVRARYGEPLVSIGHSFGGQALGLSDALGDSDGIVLAGAQLGYFRHWPARDRAKLALIWYGLVPTLTRTVGYLPGWSGIGEELPAGVADEWARWCRSPGYYLDHVPEARARLRAIDRPILALSASDDEFAPRPAIDAFLAELPNASIEHRHLIPAELGVKRIGHFGFFRHSLRGTVWCEILDFVDRVADRELARRAA